jgi:hypothetical protein
MKPNGWAVLIRGKCSKMLIIELLLPLLIKINKIVVCFNLSRKEFFRISTAQNVIRKLTICTLKNKVIKKETKS